MINLLNLTMNRLIIVIKDELKLEENKVALTLSH